MDEKICSEIVSILENLDNIYRPRISTNLKYEYNRNSTTKKYL